MVYSEDAAACYDVEGQLPCLVSLDPLSDLKAYECLLRACRMLVQAGHDFLLFAYDTGKEEYNIWQMAEELRLLDRLSFVPFQQPRSRCCCMGTCTFTCCHHRGCNIGRWRRWGGDWRW